MAAHPVQDDVSVALEHDLVFTAMHELVYPPNLSPQGFERHDVKLYISDNPGGSESLALAIPEQNCIARRKLRTNVVGGLYDDAVRHLVEGGGSRPGPGCLFIEAGTEYLLERGLGQGEDRDDVGGENRGAEREAYDAGARPAPAEAECGTAGSRDDRLRSRTGVLSSGGDCQRR